jgi:hypothetical protein
LTQDNEKKHSMMTLMDFQQAMAWAATPQAESRIGSLDALDCMLRQLKRENKDNAKGDGEKTSPFMISFGGS